MNVHALEIMDFKLCMGLECHYIKSFMDDYPKYDLKFDNRIGAHYMSYIFSIH